VENPKLRIGSRFSCDELTNETKTHWRVAEVNEKNPKWKKSAFLLRKKALVGKTVRVRAYKG
jgi:hypothetical protein